MKTDISEFWMVVVYGAFRRSQKSQIFGTLKTLCVFYGNATSPR
ncbi:MAG: hypothetical protein V1837_08020 [Candidatus Woesearchaeota archaeon]